MSSIKRRGVCAPTVFIAGTVALRRWSRCTGPTAATAATTGRTSRERRALHRGLLGSPSRTISAHRMLIARCAPAGRRPCEPLAATDSARSARPPRHVPRMSARENASVGRGERKETCERRWGRPLLDPKELVHRNACDVFDAPSLQMEVASVYGWAVQLTSPRSPKVSPRRHGPRGWSVRNRDQPARMLRRDDARGTPRRWR
jgi:hypothetical protein